MKEIIGYTTAITALLKVDSGPNTNGHEYVDLELPSGTLWATISTTPNKDNFSSLKAWGGDWYIPTQTQLEELFEYLKNNATCSYGEPKNYDRYDSFIYTLNSTGKTITIQSTAYMPASNYAYLGVSANDKSKSLT